MENLKVGDKIRYLGANSLGLTRHATYMIHGNTGNGTLKYFDDDGRERFLLRGISDNFERVSDEMTELKKGDFVRYLGGDPNDWGELTVGKVYEIVGVDIERDPFVDADNGHQWFVCAEEGNLDCFVKVFDDLPDSPVAPIVSDYEKKAHTFEEEPNVGEVTDAVNSPLHYKRGKFETIEIIEHMTQGYSDPFVSYCVGNTVKYVDRAPYKHATPVEDLRKAAWYLTRAADYIEGKSGAKDE